MSKSDVTALVDKRFGHLGGEARELVLQLALSPRRMKGFLSRLNLDPERDLQGQLDVLFFYLVRQTDLRGFLTRARIEVAKDMYEPARNGFGPPASKVVSNSAVDAVPPPSGRAIPAQVASTQALPVDPPAAQTPPPAPAVVSVSPLSVPGIIIPITEFPAETPMAEPTPEPLVEPREWIEHPNYTGPCRRTGPACRRVTPDRRAKVDSVMGNRRFGGDRRKNPRGRRKDDPVKPG